MPCNMATCLAALCCEPVVSDGLTSDEQRKPTGTGDAEQSDEEAHTWQRILQLPAPVQFDIMRSLPLASRRALRLTSRDAKLMVDDSVCRVTLCKLAQNPEDAAIQGRVLNTYTNVKELHLSCEGMNTLGMQHFIKLNATLMKRLTSLTAHHAAILLPETWDAIIRSCDASRLQVWAPCIGNRRFPAFVQQVLHLASQPRCALTTLDLSHSPITMSELEQVVRGCPQLTVLNLDNVVTLTDKGLAVLAKLQNLQRLSVDKCSLTCEGFAALSRLPSLSHVNLGAQKCQATLAGCLAVASLPALTTLHIINFNWAFPCMHVLLDEKHVCHKSLRHLIFERSDISRTCEQEFRCLVEELPLLTIECIDCSTCRGGPRLDRTWRRADTDMDRGLA